ncbi:FkbM family methyltransferase [Microvirga aerophila]|uniref:FkbM family methyltransferase n=1 Tax=Microvirga aerophila TaxID=670291 RepID=UPI000DEEE681|nr:FkbM family methyltransferase [Microvirga aerophila]
MRLSVLRGKKLLRGARSKLGRRALTFGVGASVEHDNSFRRQEYRTIVDVGANRGQFALFARERFPEARIVSFEPLTECAKIYRSIFSDDPLTTVQEVAIGPVERVENIHVTSDKDSSSFLPPADHQSAIFGSEVTGRRPVSVVRLFSVLKPEAINQPALLKIDVQGFELDVLKGCDDLNCFDDIYVEASYLELYKNQPLVSEIVTYLQGYGFCLRGVFNQFDDPKSGPVQADFLFSRSSS